MSGLLSFAGYAVTAQSRTLSGISPRLYSPGVVTTLRVGVSSTGVSMGRSHIDLAASTPTCVSHWVSASLLDDCDRQFEVDDACFTGVGVRVLPNPRERAALPIRREEAWRAT